MERSYLRLQSPNMKQICFKFNVLLLACTICSTLSAEAQSNQARGALRFANACAANGRVLFTIDGRKWRPDGFGPGENTTYIGVLSGSHRLTVSTDGAKAAEMSFGLQPNTDTTVVAFLKPVFDPQTRQTVVQAQLFAQPEPPHEKGKHFYILYASANTGINLTVNGQARILRPLQLEKADDRAHSTIKLESGGRSFFDFAAEENGTFVVIVFDKPDGTIGAMVLPNYG